MRIEWGERAEAELEELADYYGQFDPLLPDELIERAYQATFSLQTHPRLGTAVGRKGLLKWPIRKTPFLLFYVVETDRIIVIHVRHSASDWQSAL